MSFRKAKIQNYSNSNLKQELYEGQGTKKGTSEEMSCLVDYTSKLSNLFDDFKKLDDFAQSIENQENGNTEGLGSPGK